MVFPGRLVAAACLALLALAALPAAPPDSVKRSTDAGVKLLKQIREQPTGVKKHPIGAVALWGLTLLECDVPASDPAIQKAAAELRQASLDLTHNYSIALCILFFDRLGEPADTYLVQTLAVRLLAGQRYADGWSYKSPPPSTEEARLLNAWLKGRPQAKPPARDAKKVPPLPAELNEQVRLLRTRLASAPAGEVGDNSNTQLAVMALWVARRYGVPVDDAMARVSGRFRKSQSPDGGWGYLPTRTPGGEPSTPSMTCAGLLALAMSHAVAVETMLRDNPQATQLPMEPARDPAIRAGLIALGNAIRAERSKTFYFLWSLERVGVAYNLPTIGEVDWYTWGAESLFAKQRADGGWRSEEGPDVDTCFALLFLRRANLTRDLSTAMKGVKDPGQATLKATGIGTSSLVTAPGTDPAATLPKDLDPEAARLCVELLKAAPDRQPGMIDRLKDSKGVIYTDALAAVIPRLAGTPQEKARDALAERFTRMSATTLRGKLTEDDIEVRVAVIRACATKEERSHVPDLIALLADPQPRVSRAAHTALKVLTRQDFGPPTEATPAERAKAAAAWQAWWQKRPGK